MKDRVTYEGMRRTLQRIECTLGLRSLCRCGAHLERWQDPRSDQRTPSQILGGLLSVFHRNQLNNLQFHEQREVLEAVLLCPKDPDFVVSCGDHTDAVGLLVRWVFEGLCDESFTPGAHVDWCINEKCSPERREAQIQTIMLLRILRDWDQGYMLRTWGYELTQYLLTYTHRMRLLGSEGVQEEVKRLAHTYDDVLSKAVGVVSSRR